MASLKTLKLSLEAIAGGNICILTGQEPMKEYKDNQYTGAILGTKYHMVGYKNCFFSFTVAIKGGAMLNITEDAIAEACANLRPIFVTLDGFDGRINKNNDSITCTATGIRIVPQEEALSELDLFDEK